MELNSQTHPPLMMPCSLVSLTAGLDGDVVSAAAAAADLETAVVGGASICKATDRPVTRNVTVGFEFELEFKFEVEFD